MIPFLSYCIVLNHQTILERYFGTKVKLVMSLGIETMFQDQKGLSEKLYFWNILDIQVFVRSGIFSS